MMRLATLTIQPAGAMLWQASLGAAVVLLPAALTGPLAAQSMKVTCLVRDFQGSHPDFNVTPSGGMGHYAGNIGLSLDTDGRPVFTGSGYQVASQWTDADGRPIPPQLFEVWSSSCSSGMGIGIVVDEQLDAGNQSSIWSYHSIDNGPWSINEAVLASNSTAPGALWFHNRSEINRPNPAPPPGGVLVGPGGDPNSVIVTQSQSDVFGFRDVLSAPIPMPVLTEPSLGPIVSGNYTADAVIDTDLHVDAFEIENNAVVTIQGNVTILSEGPAKIVNGGRLYIPVGSSLDLYLKSSMLVTTDGSDTPGNLYNGNNGMSGDPAKLHIYQLSAETIELSSNNGRMAAHVVAPQGTLAIRQDSTFRGTFIGRVLQLEQNALFTEDKSSPVVVIGGSPGDSAGAAGSADNGGITDAVTFSQWYRDVLGENLSTTHTITLTRDVSGVYEYLDDAFYPIDGMLFGNAGEPRNNYFTYTISAEFTYQSCAGQFVEFTGADDLWLFINGELAMDAGGVAPMVAQYLDLDRLGLADGATHRLELFYAHRQPISSVFRLRTDLVLSPIAGPLSVTNISD